MLDNFYFYRYKVSFIAKTNLYFPTFHGTTLRGLLGTALMRISNDLANQFFAPKPPAGFPDAGKYSTVPPPFVIVPPLYPENEYEKGDIYEFDIVLIGKGNDYLNDIISALLEVENLKISDNGKVELKNMHCYHPDNSLNRIYKTSDVKAITANDYPPFNSPTEIFGLQFLTPVLLKNFNSKTISFTDIMQRLAERINLLSTLYCDAPYQKQVGIPLDSERIVCLSASFKNVDVVHHSRRHKTRKVYHATNGRLHFKGDISPFYNILKTGEYIHIGSGTSSGLGKYRLIGN